MYLSSYVYKLVHTYMCICIRNIKIYWENWSLLYLHMHVVTICTKFDRDNFCQFLDNCSNIFCRLHYDQEFIIVYKSLRVYIFYYKLSMMDCPISSRTAIHCMEWILKYFIMTYVYSYVYFYIYNINFYM